ncbi:DNA-directed DNA polymerase [Tanacetum coccineum]|uniref:DNA-directed DNA polymerase n=1 Tax=Tanacetum coccineum TaxID=301880 RepID=A0ABQ5E9U9_9ASTR
MACFDFNQPSVSVVEDGDVTVSNSDCLAVVVVDISVDVALSSSNNTKCDSNVVEDDNASSSNSLKTPKSFNHHKLIDTHGRSVFWVPRISASVLPELETVFGNIEECISLYKNYASTTGFAVRLSSQKRLKGGYVKRKYLVCNMEGYPKKICLNTLAPKKDDKQVRTSNYRVCGCKARVVFYLVPGTTKYTLTTFDVEHNHELDRIEYKHLSKDGRKLSYVEQLFIIKAANVMNKQHPSPQILVLFLGANLYTGLKGSSSLVHGTETEFKNFTRGVNYFIGDSDAQIVGSRLLLHNI